ncbi:dihydrofolate reductase family protein [Actinoplanes derwentensis]|uniref:Dihydrofolate reductase n=1 Tax=Actinoplanes derwentensis TaxID=113562 RepID=A0A1H1VCU0_9ACTN|nr:dihydrofolate reductase family protein [Actinoplanes derwentensis]GID83741.1 deaminase [Actinoplanes derwentensis]SDS82440.1 Dihydrofolate reductase [Actinoplanes derwentensis]
MRKLVYFVASTIDGFIAAPDGTWDFFQSGEDVLGYMRDNYPETLPSHVRGPDVPSNRVFDTVLMGRHTYEPALKAGITHPYAHLEEIVFSRGLGRETADPVTVVAKLKQQPGLDIWLAGGGDLAGQLLPAIDELVIKLNPVVAGEGVPLAATGFAPHLFTLLDATPLPSGVVILRYRARR